MKINDRTQTLILKPADIVPYFMLFTAVFIIYLTFISSGYHYDSVILAQFAENGYFFIYGWQEHTLLLSINTLFYRLWTLFSFTQSALFPLAFLGSFFGALGVVVFFAIIEVLFSNRLLAFFGAIGFAFSFNYWRYSTLVETHIPSTFFIIVAVYFLALLKRNESKNNLFWSGIFTSLALFSSAAYIVFVPALLIFLWNTISPKSKKSAFIGWYIAILFFFWFIPYLLLGLRVFLKSTLLGSQGHSLWGSIEFSFIWFKSGVYAVPFQMANLMAMAKENVASVFISNHKTISALIFYTVAVLLCIFKRKNFIHEYLNIISSGLMAAFFFFGTLVFYEPFNLQRYTPSLIFVWLFICVLLKDLFLRKNHLFVKLMIFFSIIFLFVNNLTHSIIPESNPENNLLLQTSLLIKESTNKDDVVIMRGGEVWPNGTIWHTPAMLYIPYFAHRRIISFWDINAELVKTPEENERKLKKEIDLIINSGKKAIVLQDALIIDSGNTKYAYPDIYFKLSDFLQREYHISKYRENGPVIIYNLTIKQP